MNRREEKRTNSFKNIMADCYCDTRENCTCGIDRTQRTTLAMKWIQPMREQAWSGVRPSSL
ncbi:hypothetical protein KQI41_06525 [Tissierella pigra]|uniref:Uncharacterized protein n=1 Tax=Tissierella pigra TaxID=2607614 RepID=A0A6N7XTS5_9FIRM|nr:hypothetical protein [Tissierella pigra]MBU5426066.1 hypothetical protein [Tissierella pigra]MSU00813.1 hypothetical protein [Tissierella pigra]